MGLIVFYVRSKEVTTRLTDWMILILTSPGCGNLRKLGLRVGLRFVIYNDRRNRRVLVWGGLSIAKMPIVRGVVHRALLFGLCALSVCLE